MNIIRINDKAETVNVELNTNLDCVKNQTRFNQRAVFLWYTTLMESCKNKIASDNVKISEIKKTPEDKLSEDQKAEIVLLEADIERQKSIYAKYEELTADIEFFNDPQLENDVNRDSFLRLFLSPLCKCDCEITGFKSLRTCLLNYNNFEGSEEWTEDRKIAFNEIRDKLASIAGHFYTSSNDTYKNSRMNINAKDTDRMIKFFYGGHKLTKSTGNFEAGYRTEKELEKEFIKMCSAKLQRRLEK